MNSNLFIIISRTRKMYQEIDKYARENIESAHDESLNTPDVDMPCLVKVDNRGFFRGKIVDVSFDLMKCDLKVFLVDTGETVSVDSFSVFEIPDNLVEMCPYQVCLQTIWPSKQSRAHFHFLLNIKNHLISFTKGDLVQIDWHKTNWQWKPMARRK